MKKSETLRARQSSQGSRRATQPIQLCAQPQRHCGKRIQVDGPTMLFQCRLHPLHILCQGHLRGEFRGSSYHPPRQPRKGLLPAQIAQPSPPARQARRLQWISSPRSAMPSSHETCPRASICSNETPSRRHLATNSFSICARSTADSVVRPKHDLACARSRCRREPKCPPGRFLVPKMTSGRTNSSLLQHGSGRGQPGLRLTTHRASRAPAALGWQSSARLADVCRPPCPCRHAAAP